MRILIAEDDRTSRRILSSILKKKGGHDVVETVDGDQAWEVLQESDAPKLAILDWMMPKMDGLELVRRVRADQPALPPYIIMLTTKSEKSDIVAALDAGADDMVSKPCDTGELLARVEVGRRMVEAQKKLIAHADELRQTQAQLAHAQKLEAVGQLASGIAHEINNPSQFVSDSVHFFKEAYEDQSELIVKYQRALDTLRREGGHQQLLQEIREAEETADLEFLDEHAPAAFERCIEGLSRISSIVGAMKEFAHPDQDHKDPADLNEALEATLTIAKNEYRYVADVETELEDLPSVLCHVGSLNQVFLNLIVNAAHAVGDVVGGTGERGSIRVRTARNCNSVRIEIEDTGRGVPAAIRHRIFDPFFTTKEVGKGSGQGLAIARSVVVDKHNGTLACESEEGKGATFVIRLPIDGGV